MVETGAGVSLVPTENESMSMPAGLALISIVIPTWNRAQLLRDVVRSLLTQDYSRDLYEIVVVDDGSTDSTQEVVRSFSESRGSKPPIHYVGQPHQGLNAARNTGLRNAVGDPICFLDDDTHVPPGWLPAIAKAVKDHPEVDCLGGPIRLRLEGTPPRLCGREPLGDSELDLGAGDRFLEPGEGRSELLFGANISVRRTAVRRIGMFDERLPLYGDEIEWELRLQRSGGRILYVADAWLWHRRQAQDLRLMRMLRVRFRRGVGRAFFESRVGVRASPRGHLIAAARMLFHCVRRRCASGLLSAVENIAIAYGQVFLVKNEQRGAEGSRGPIAAADEINREDLG